MIVFFRVEENIGSCMFTFSQFKLHFNPSTIIFQSQSLAIPHYSLTLFTSERIGNYRNGLNYLIGVYISLSESFFVVFFSFLEELFWDIISLN
jgi:hypothetical protein